MVDLLLLLADYLLVDLGLFDAVNQTRVVVVLIPDDLLHRPADIKHYQQNRILLLTIGTACLLHHPHVVSGKFELLRSNYIFMLAEGTNPYNIILIFLEFFHDISELSLVRIDLLVVID